MKVTHQDGCHEFIGKPCTCQPTVTMGPAAQHVWDHIDDYEDGGTWLRDFIDAGIIDDIMEDYRAGLAYSLDQQIGTRDAHNSEDQAGDEV